MRRLTLLPLLLAPAMTIGANAEPSCNPPRTTYDFNMCPDPEFDRAVQDLQRYLKASVDSVAKDAAALDALNAAQDAWEEYRDLHCGAVFTKWRDGTIRNQKESQCRFGLIRERTHELWLQYLKPVDRSPAVLPEPTK